MRNTIIGCICLLSMPHLHAQVSDSTVKVLSDFICNCIDTLNLNKPKAELKKTFNTCRTYALVNLLNSQLIKSDLLTNKKKANDLDMRTFKLLDKECAAAKRLMTALTKLPIYREKNDDNIFTPVAFFKTYGLQPGEVNNLLHVYNSEKSDIAKYQRLVDIRWTFESEAEALEWHREKMRENSEEGKPVKEPINVEGATELKVFREGTGTADMLKSFDLKQRHHYFLFVYKNIVCKIFVATDDKTETKELVHFAVAAVKQLKTVIR